MNKDNFEVQELTEEQRKELEENIKFMLNKKKELENE